SPGGAQNGYQGTLSGTNQMLTNLQLLRFAVPLTYHIPLANDIKGFSVAFSPILQYGTLDIAYNNGAYYQAPSVGNGGTVTFVPQNVMTGNGVSQDFGLGYNFGLAYEFSNLTLGVVYTSAIDMTYKNQISSASKNFGLNRGAGFSDHLEQPAEVGMGASYKIGESSTLALDYKQIQWAGAKGYKDFKWQNQNVIALGYEYSAKKWALRTGINYAENPIVEQDGSNYDGAVINYFNAAGFPATIKTHIAFGGTYNFTDTIGLDIAYVYAPQVKETYDTSGLTKAQVFAGTQAAGGSVPDAVNASSVSSSEAIVKHAQSSLSLAMTIKF
ncbi:MAG TPA: hypothetical protein ENK65_03510, partial [Helicobacteraceae bacterium]|nr:hypothetical protein [Helicobacteraceae bacterium]